MISRMVVAPPLPTWQRSLREVVGTVGELLAEVGLSPGAFPDGLLAGSDFPVRVPRELVRRVQPGDPDDPILLQVVPRAAEAETVDGFGGDPVGERDRQPAPGLVHKYRGRVLLIATGACAVNCRYCFRRHFPYAENPGGPEWWRGALDWMERDRSLREVILSGGDPLVLDDDKLGRLAAALGAIEHLVRLRIHTRLPVVIPSRIDDRLLSWLVDSRLQPVVVIHANHARELDDEVAAALGRLRAAGIAVLNQSVLLRSVNDSVDALVELSERLFEIGVVPYYLHQLDRVAGAAHFEVADDVARRLIKGVERRLSGYLVPRLVREVAGEGAKVRVGV